MCMQALLGNSTFIEDVLEHTYAGHQAHIVIPCCSFLGRNVHSDWYRMRAIDAAFLRKGDI